MGEHFGDSRETFSVTGKRALDDDLYRLVALDGPFDRLPRPAEHAVENLADGAKLDALVVRVELCCEHVARAAD